MTTLEMLGNQSNYQTTTQLTACVDFKLTLSVECKICLILFAFLFNFQRFLLVGVSVTYWRKFLANISSFVTQKVWGQNWANTRSRGHVTNKIISPFAADLQPSNQARWSLVMKASKQYNHVTSCWSRDRMIKLYIHFYKTSNH